MGPFKEYDQYDGLGLAQLVRDRKVSAEELTETAINRIEEVNPKLNAVIHKMYDVGKAEMSAGLPKGPFHGVPFLIKDLLADFNGQPMRSGSRSHQSYVSKFDAEIIKRYRASGVVFLGKTSTPEFGLLGITEPELFGATRNPWNTDHTPGGSSGGSGAAVASGMVPIASGGDGGGSIRIPASHCGLFGLKPSRGRNPSGPKYGDHWQGAVSEHILSRSVRDSAAMLDAIHGPESGSRLNAPHYKGLFLDEVSRDPGSLRIAFSLKSPIGREVDPECQKAVRDTAKLLEDLGHKVEEMEPEIDFMEQAMSYFAMVFCDTASQVIQAKNILGRKPRASDFELTTWILHLLGKAYRADELISALAVWDRAARSMGKFHQTYDIYMTPTTAFPSVRIGELQPKGGDLFMMKMVKTFGLGKLLKKSGAIEEIAMNALEKTPFTQLGNLTGQPGMSVPMHMTPGGLPVGVQMMSAYGNEALLFRLAGQLEQAKPWFDKRPAIANV